MPVVLNALVFGLAVTGMLIGLAGIVIPILPGTLLIWLSVLAYALIEGFEALDWATFIFVSLIALVTGTADLWLTVLGSKRAGAGGWTFVYGFLGGIIGFFLLGSLLPIIGSLFGGIIGYSAGILLGEYRKLRDWNQAIKASLGGFVGWGVATVIQLVGGLLILIIFIWQVLSY